MAAIRMVYIQCDTPDCACNTADEMFDTATEARRHARRNGWSYGATNGDRCPWCRAGVGPYSHGDEHIKPLPGENT